MYETGYHDTWLDRTHAFFTRTFCQPAVWFDNFFGEDRSMDEGWPGTAMRMRLTYRLDEEQDASYRARFHASFRLPKASRKVKLIISGKTEDDATDVLPGSDPLDQEAPQVPEDNEVAAGLRLAAVEKPRSKLTLGGGVKLRDPPDPYVRVRFRYTLPLGDRTQIRAVPSVQLTEQTGVTRSVRMDIERMLEGSKIIRLSHALTRTEDIPGLTWGTEVSYLVHISDKKALSVDLGQRGVTRPSTITTRYRLGSRLRVNFFRPWIFFEVEPEVYWPRDDSSHYRKVHAISFRLEAQFIT